MSDDPLREILRRDDRYARAAYDFIGESLRRASGQKQHVTPAELLESVRDHARETFGSLARAVLEEWGVRTTLDIGNIVFNCIGEEVMGASDEDSIEDFADVYRFAEAFPLEADGVEIIPPGTDDDE